MHCCQKSKHIISSVFNKIDITSLHKVSVFFFPYLISLSLFHKIFFAKKVFCGKIPKDMYEDELIPLFEKCGKIWDLRLMMDPMSGSNRGYAFITFTNREAAQQAVREVC